MSDIKHSIVLISTADWDNPYWTNKQHMAVQFAQRGHKVFYIESVGLRAPTVTKKDFKRLLQRLKRGLRPPRQVAPNILVWSPVVIPLQRYTLVRKINKFLLSFGIWLYAGRGKVKPSLYWTYSPMTTELYSIKDDKFIVYHAVDDIKAQPGMPTEAIEKAEAVLSRRADLILTTAPALYDFHKTFNPNTYYFSNVADYAHFNTALNAETQIPEDVAHIPGPRIGFVGAISSYKIDFRLIKQVADQHTDWSFVFIGEIGEGDPNTDASIFNDCKNIHFLGGRAYSTLPSYLKAVDVAILPNLINSYTQSMFPMKFFEYLAAGKKVVATDLPALSDYRHVATFCKNANEFGEAIALALADKGASLEDRLAAAREQTYDSRTEKMMKIVEEKMAKKKE